MTVSFRRNFLKILSKPLFKSFLLCFLWGVSHTPLVQAQGIPTKVEELNGFALWQYQTAIRHSLGQPSETIATDSSTSDVHFLSEQGYMVFEYCKTFPQNVCSIQITGRVFDMEPFLGLRLGDAKQKVQAVLGPPSNIETSEDTKVQTFRYASSNISVELDEYDRLFTIRVAITKDMLRSSKPIGDPWAEFVSALKEHNTAEIMKILRPDVEIQRDGAVLSIEKKYSDFRKAPDQIFMQALQGPEKSVLAQALTETPEGALRLTRDLGTGLVYTFKVGEILNEVVFFPFNGRMRVYEISFKATKVSHTFKEENGREDGQSTKKELAGKSANDPFGYSQGFIEQEILAMQGNARAQANVGIMYEVGAGTPQDFVQAFKWYTLAKKGGEEVPADLWDGLIEKMTPDQIQEAKHLASEWKPKGGDSPQMASTDANPINPSNKPLVQNDPHEALNPYGIYKFERDTPVPKIEGYADWKFTDSIAKLHNDRRLTFKKYGEVGCFVDPTVDCFVLDTILFDHSAKMIIHVSQDRIKKITLSFFFAERVNECKSTSQDIFVALNQKYGHFTGRLSLIRHFSWESVYGGRLEFSGNCDDLGMIILYYEPTYGL